MPRCGVTWSRPRSRSTSIESARFASGANHASDAALDADLPASSRPASASSTARSSTSHCPRSAPATAPAPSKCNGSSTPIFCRCPRCCCSAARWAIISGGGACSSSARACSRSPRSSARWRRALPLLLAARAAQGVGAALLLPNSLALLNAAYSGEKRGRAVGSGPRPGPRRRDRASDRRLAGRTRSAGRRSSTSTCRSPRARSCSRSGSSRRAAKRAPAAPTMPGRLLATARARRRSPTASPFGRHSAPVEQPGGDRARRRTRACSRVSSSPSSAAESRAMMPLDCSATAASPASTC